nr:DUF3558 family protein [Rhodococcus sp. HNM0569]
MTRTLALVVGTLSLVAGLAACGDTESDVANETTSTQPIEISYHPCDELPPDVMAGFGLDLSKAYREERMGPVSFNCIIAHRAPRYGAGFYAMGQTFDDVVADERLVEKERLTVAGHTTSLADFTSGFSCMATIDIAPEVLQVSVDYTERESLSGEWLSTVDQACAEAKKIVNALGPYLPERL